MIILKIIIAIGAITATIGVYIYIRVYLIHKEIKNTGELKKWGFLEEFIKPQIMEDIETYKKNLQ